MGFYGDGRKLSGDFHPVLIVHTLFLTFTRLPAVFINTMMVGQSGGLDAVLLYNGAFYLFGAVFMALAAKVLCRLGSRLTAIMGIAVYFVLYFTIFMLGEAAARYSVLIGVINGLADGFYWIAYLQLFSSTTDLDNRDKAMAVIQLLGAAVNLLMPLTGSLVIQAVGGLKGYMTVFAIAFLLALFTCLYTVKLPKLRQNSPKTNYAAAIGFLRRHRIRSALAGQFVKGMREGTFLFILSVVIYQLVRSEVLVGVSTFLSGGASIIAYGVMSRLLNPTNRMRYMLYAVIALTVTAFAGFLWVTPQMILVYCVINALFCGFLENTSFTIFLDSTTGDKDASQHMPEMLAINEIVLVAGRICGMLIILAVLRFLGESVRWELFSLLLLTLTQFAVLVFSGRADTDSYART
jgi:MFS family permease